MSNSTVPDLVSGDGWQLNLSMFDRTDRSTAGMWPARSPMDRYFN